MNTYLRGMATCYGTSGMLPSFPAPFRPLHGPRPHQYPLIKGGTSSHHWPAQYCTYLHRFVYSHPCCYNTTGYMLIVCSRIAMTSSVTSKTNRGFAVWLALSLATRKTATALYSTIRLKRKRLYDYCMFKS